MGMIFFRSQYPDQLDWQGRLTDWALLKSKVVASSEGVLVGVLRTQGGL
jgi:hypothetical protein